MLTMRIATPDDVTAIDSLFINCIQYLNEQGIHQWSPVYPNRSTFEDAVTMGNQYVIEDQETLVGAVILNEEQAKEWLELKWSYESDKILAIHALGVLPAKQGRGYGQAIIHLFENFALDRGYEAIRFDAFPDNKGAVHLYEKNQYEYVGTVSFDYKPKGYQNYYCYEKKLSPKNED